MQRKQATVMITRIVRPGHEADYRRWLSETLNAAETFPNHLGTVVLTPTTDANVYRFVHLFADDASLEAWEKSEVHHRLSAEADRFSHSSRDEAVGMTAWFTVAGMSPVSPPRWKMTIVIFGVVYLLTAILIPLQVKWTPPSWPFLLTNAILNIVIAVAMTYAVMPAATRLLRDWLY
jgi:antibiotic biosynthesis monooxygenase (ABM) superfamily enzyme